MDFETFKKSFADRLRLLRNERNISAREMSLALGQNVNYINYIENGKHLPSMQGFFLICDYLSMRPAEFFDEHNAPQADSPQPDAMAADRENLIAQISERVCTQLKADLQKNIAAALKDSGL